MRWVGRDEREMERVICASDGEGDLRIEGDREG